MLLDSSTNQYGIPVDQATDEELGWDVAFKEDGTVKAVEQAKSKKFGKEGMPAGYFPVVTINPKTLARVQAQRAAAAESEE